MNFVIEPFLRLFLIYIVYPIAMELIRKRDTDPAFKAELDQAYIATQNAQTSAERKIAAKRLYELQKKYQS